MIDSNELREMADEIDHSIELEQEKLKQEKKVVSLRRSVGNMKKQWKTWTTI